jgi:hypothetical protein
MMCDRVCASLVGQVGCFRYKMSKAMLWLLVRSLELQSGYWLDPFNCNQSVELACKEHLAPNQLFLLLSMLFMMC